MRQFLLSGVLHAFALVYFLPIFLGLHIHPGFIDATFNSSGLDLRNGTGANSDVYALSLALPGAIDPAFGAMACAISITGTTVVKETCPGTKDGSITVDASCTSCGGG